MGPETALGQGPGVPRLQGDAGVGGPRDAAVELRSQHELSGCPGPGRHGDVQARRRGRIPGGVDHHPVDTAVEPGGLRRRGHRLRAGARQGQWQDPLPGAGTRFRLCETPRPRGAGRGQGRRARRARVRAPLPLLPRRGGAGGLRRRRRRLRHHRRGHGPRPPGPGVRRGRLPGAARARHRGVCLPGGHGRGLHEGRDGLRRAVRQGRRRPHHGLAEGGRRPLRPGRRRTPISLLLPLGHAAHLPRRALVVRARDRPRRRPGRGECGDPLGAGPHQGRPLRQLARGRRGLGHLAQPGVGHAAADLGERRHRQPDLHGFDRGAGALHGPACGGPAPGVRGPADLRDRGGGGHLLPGGGSARLLVRVGFHAVCAAPLPVREPAGLRAGLSRRVHRRGARPDPRLVLHADRPCGGSLPASGLPQRHRQRPGDGRRRQEDVEEPAQLHAARRVDGELRRGRPAAVPHQLRPRARRGPALRRPGRARHGAPGAAALVQRVRFPAHLRPYRRLGAGPGLPPGRQHPGPLGALEAADDEGGDRAGDGRLPPLQRGAEAVRVHRGPHELVHPPQPAAVLGPGHHRGQDRRLQHSLHGGSRVVPRDGAVCALPLRARLPPVGPARRRRGPEAGERPPLRLPGARGSADPARARGRRGPHAAGRAAGAPQAGGGEGQLAYAAAHPHDHPPRPGPARCDRGAGGLREDRAQRQGSALRAGREPLHRSVREAELPGTGQAPGQAHA